MESFFLTFHQLGVELCPNSKAFIKKNSPIPNVINTDAFITHTIRIPQRCGYQYHPVMPNTYSDMWDKHLIISPILKRSKGSLLLDWERC